MKLLEINFSKLSVMLLPTFMRSASVVELLRILVLPFSYVQGLFFANRTKNLYNLNYNGQVCHLRAVLNDAFPIRTKSFIIDDAQDTGVWEYVRDEDRIYDQLIVPDEPECILLYDEETMTKFADFVVRIPVELESVDNMNVIRALVNTYKLISKKAIYEYY